jgi:2-oxoglutarate dehydrogenase E2 component (dihydrolipoamide succinyltransferase)
VAGRVGGKDVANAPSAEKLMAEKGIDAASVQGTGRDGRIMKEDVLKAGSAPARRPRPPRQPTAAGPARARRRRGRGARGAGEDDPPAPDHRRRLKDAQNTAAMLTTYNEVDMTEVMALRNTYKDEFEKKHGVRLGFMSFFTKACVHALKEVPEVNAEIDGTDVVYKNYVHMGIAAGTPQGLVVPVLRDVDQKSFAAIEKEIGEKGPPRARRQAVDGRDAGRHLHDLERRRLRLAHVLADPEPAAVGHPRHAQDPGTARWSSAARS